MGQPKRKPDDDSDENHPVPGAAPEAHAPLEADEIESMADIDAYQKRLEDQWESTKSNYQGKINRIMDDFIQQNIHSIDFTAEPKKEKRPFLGLFQGKEKSETPMDSILSKAENALRAAENRSKHLSFGNEKPTAININWRDSNSPNYLHILVSILIFIGGYFAYNFFQVGAETSLPYARTGGVAVANGKIYIADWMRKDLYVHKAQRGLPLISVENLPNDYITGFALTDKKIWTTEGINHQILEHAMSADHAVIHRSPSPGDAPVGLFFDGTDLWSMDNDTKKLYRHKGNDLEEIRDEYTLPNVTLTSFVINNNRLWVLNRKSRSLVVYRLDETVKELASYDLDGFLKGAEPTAMAMTGKKIWITTENPARLLKISRSALKKAKPDQF